MEGYIKDTTTNSRERADWWKGGDNSSLTNYQYYIKNWIEIKIERQNREDNKSDEETDETYF